MRVMSRFSSSLVNCNMRMSLCGSPISRSRSHMHAPGGHSLRIGKGGDANISELACGVFLEHATFFNRRVSSAVRVLSNLDESVG